MATNSHSSLFILLCSGIFGMQGKTLSQRRSLEVLHPQRSPFLPFLPGWPLNKSFNQESSALVISSSGIWVLNTAGQALLQASNRIHVGLI